MKQDVVFTSSAIDNLTELLEKTNYDKLFILTDTTTQNLCLPIIKQSKVLDDAHCISIGTGDINKTTESLIHVWEELSKHGGTRHSLMINLGGGMVTDLGGFAASTFKRGIKFINIPTTLLAMVDASVGGKTGINFNGLKNEIGVFQNALSVIIDTIFLRSLDQDNIRSGYAEMLKHGLISTESHLTKLLQFDLTNPDFSELLDLLKLSVEVKQNVVLEDPTEKGIRKALNFGHTIGHAFESLAMKNGNPTLHGYAVAWGMIAELYLSCIKCNFPTKIMRQTIQFIKENYGILPIDCKQYDQIYEFTTHDKKNQAGVINCTLLSGVGDLQLDQKLSKDDIVESLDFFREG